MLIGVTFIMLSNELLFIRLKITGKPTKQNPQINDLCVLASATGRMIFINGDREEKGETMCLGGYYACIQCNDPMGGKS